MQLLEQGVARQVADPGRDGGQGAAPEPLVGAGHPAAVDQAVGEEQEPGGRGRARARPRSTTGRSTQPTGGPTGSAGIVVRPASRNGAGWPARVTRQVRAVRVDAGQDERRERLDRGPLVADDRVEGLEGAVPARAGQGEGPPGGPQGGAEGGRLGPVPRDVADHDREAAVRQLDRVQEVPAEQQPALAGAVAGGHHVAAEAAAQARHQAGLELGVQGRGLVAGEPQPGLVDGQRGLVGEALGQRQRAGSGLGDPAAPGQGEHGVDLAAVGQRHPQDRVGRALAGPGGPLLVLLLLQVGGRTRCAACAAPGPPPSAAAGGRAPSARSRATARAARTRRRRPARSPRRRCRRSPPRPRRCRSRRRPATPCRSGTRGRARAAAGAPR